MIHVLSYPLTACGLGVQTKEITCNRLSTVFIERYTSNSEETVLNNEMIWSTSFKDVIEVSILYSNSLYFERV